MYPEKPKLPKRTPAQRLFYRQYLPYIKEKVLENAPVSYLTADQITDKWGEIIPWDETFANKIIFLSKVFFKLSISPDSQNVYNPEFIEDVINQIIDHLMIYFARAPHYKNAENAAREYLLKKLNTENAFLACARIRQQNILRARERRAAAHAEAAKQTQAEQEKVSVGARPKRQRIQYKQYTDEFNKVRRAMRIDIENQK